MDKIFGQDTLFAKIMNMLGDIVWTGILFVITSIPLFTVGAALCAAYQVMIKVVRGKNSGVTSLYFEVFRENIGNTVLIKVLGYFILAFLLFDCIYLYGYGTTFSSALSMILYVIIAVYIMVVSYIYPLISRFDEKNFELFKIAFYLTFRYIHLSVILLLCFVFAIVAVYLMPWSIIIVPGLYLFMASFPQKRALALLAGDKPEKNEDEDMPSDKVNEKAGELEADEGEDDDEYEDQSKEEESSEEKVKKTVSGTYIVKRRRLKNPWRKKNKEEELEEYEEAEESDEDTGDLEDELVRDKEREERLRDIVIEKKLNE